MKTAIVFLSLIMLPFAHAGTLKGTNGVEILALDGKLLERKFFSTNTIELSDNTHQVVVRYNKNFQNDDLITSKAHVFMVDVKGDTEISVKYFLNQYTAENAIKNGLTWIVENEDKTDRVYGADTISKKGFLPNKDLELQIASYNNEHGISLLATATKPAVATTGVASTAAVVTAPVVKQTKTKAAAESKPVTQPSSKELLIAIYQNASKEERKAFRIWLLEQDMN